MFDPNKRENLSPAQRGAIAQIMQYGLLDGIMGGGVWDAGDIVFQGGTGLHIVYNSPRFSEDLDFMLSFDRSADLTRVMERTARDLQKRLSLILPRSETRLKTGGGAIGSLREVIRHDIVWTHPSKRGAVRVRAEFFTVERSHIESYLRENRRHKPDLALIAGRPELNGFDIDALTVSALIPAATPESIYGDKMVALAKREYLKPRDFFDLWWLNRTMGVRLDDDALYAAMRRSADCYAYDDHEIGAGLQNLMQNPADLSNAIEKNLGAFLPDKLFRQLASDSAFGEMYTHVMAESGRLSDLVTARNGPAPAPTP